MRKILIALGLSLLVEGCNTIGSTHMPSERQDYNEAMANSNNQQLLLNIVRLHDGVPPLFLEISNISTQATVSASSGGLGSFAHAATLPAGTDTTTLNAPGFSWSETPTISYSPLQGADFANHLLEPLPLRYVYFLCRSGWPIDQVFSLTLEDINNLPNALESSPYSYHKNHENFDRVLKDFRALQLKDDLRFYYSLYHNHEDIPILVINVSSQGKKTAAWQELVKLLHLKASHKQLVMSEYYPGYTNGDLYVETRSFFGVLSYLSASVPPKREMSENQNWLEVKISDTQPKSSYLSVVYGHHWYYLDEQDDISKTTMLALFELFQLATGENVKTSPPVLTLPLH